MGLREPVKGVLGIGQCVHVQALKIRHDVQAGHFRLGRQDSGRFFQRGAFHLQVDESAGDLAQLLGIHNRCELFDGAFAVQRLNPCPGIGP